MSHSGPVASMDVSDDLRIMTVHAHPDDEASKGAATIARYHQAGVRSILVCCTGGEEGEIQNPDLDLAHIVDRLPYIRAAELELSRRIIGYDELLMLGYRDSGMPDSEANDHAESFHSADLDAAVGRLVEAIRRFRPQVIVTYPDDQQGYRHPDHIRVNEISEPAFDRAGDPAWYPEAGAPWEPLKLYYTVWSRVRIEALHEAYLAQGIESPYNEGWFTRPSQDDRISTKIDIAAYYGIRSAALRAHATQVDPRERFWFGLPDAVAAAAYPWDDYILARARVATPEQEYDLFAGIAEVLPSPEFEPTHFVPKPHPDPAETAAAAAP